MKMKRWMAVLLLLLMLPGTTASGAEDLDALLADAAESQAKEAVEVPTPNVSAEAVYAFHDHLFTAEAVTYLKEREVAGEWRQTRFVFQGLDPKAEIRLNPPPPGGGAATIEYHPLPQAVRRLVFYDAIPGAQIVLYYRVEQEKQTKENNYMTLTVWAGRHRVKRLRLAATPKKWLKEIVDLREVVFLNRQVPLTFEIGSDPSGLLLFRMIAEINR